MFVTFHRFLLCRSSCAHEQKSEDNDLKCVTYHRNMNYRRSPREKRSRKVLRKRDLEVSSFWSTKWGSCDLIICRTITNVASSFIQAKENSELEDSKMLLLGPFDIIRSKVHRQILHSMSLCWGFIYMTRRTKARLVYVCCKFLSRP